MVSSEKYSARRFQAALGISIALHLGAATGFGWPDRLTQPSRLLETPRVTELLYVGHTGPALQLAQAQSEEFLVAPSHLEALKIPKDLKDVVHENSSSFPPSIAAEGRLQRESILDQVEDDVDRESPDEIAMQPYLNRVRALLSRKIRFPKGAAPQVLILNFSVNRSGVLTGCRLKTPAAAALAEQAIRGLQAAAPFPPFPGDWNRSEAIFTVRLLFNSDPA